MTSRDGRGGPRVPDGVQRPSSLPFARGPNRSDMSELPGTPGTPLPPGPGQPGNVPHGQAGRLRQRLGNIPLESISPNVALGDGTQRPQEPLTSGVDVGAGLGSGALLPSPGQLNDRLTAQEMRAIYPLLMRLATLPNATTETRILAQRVRSQLPVAPEQMPDLGEFNGLPGPSR